MVLKPVDALLSQNLNRSRAALSVKRLLACIIAAFIVVGLTVPVAAAAARPPKVVIIVGPVGPGMTDRFRAQADEAARIARRYTPDVVKIYSPNATWPAVREALQGASVVVYMGHGNGWPSRYRDSLYPPTQNGFGLNPTAGGGDSKHQYFGEGIVGSQVKLAKNAVVLLHHLCYASGNTEPGLPEGTLDQAKQRVDNYAAGFIEAGAAAVAADAWSSPAYMLRSVLAGDRSIERIWRSAPSTNGNFLGFKSKRSPGYVAEMDPQRAASGFKRSIVLREGLASRDVLAGGRGNAAAFAVAQPDPPAAPTLAGAGITVDAPLVRGLTSAGVERNVRLPMKIKDRAKLPDDLQASVRWDPIDVSVVPTDPTNEVEAEAEAEAEPEPVEEPQVEEPAASSAPPLGSPAPSAEAEPAPSDAPLEVTASTRPSAAEDAPAPADPDASDPPAASDTPAASPPPDLGGNGQEETGPKPWVDQPEAVPAHEPPVPAGPPTDLGLVQPESLGDVVQPVEGTYQRTGVLFPVKLPSAPGLYRLTLTLHDADGVAYDAATQALVSPMLVRVVGDFDARVLATTATTLEAGSAVPLQVRVANLGKAAWGHLAVVDHDRRGGGEPAEAADVVGHWVALDPAAADGVGARTRTALPPALEAGKTVDTALDLEVPTEPGEYLLVLDVVTPENGSLAALGVRPTIVRVTVVPAP